MMIAKSVERKRPGLPWMIPSWAVALVLSLTIMAGIGLAGPTGSAATEAAAGSSPLQASALAPDATCELAWRVVSSPDPEGELRGRLNGVAAVSANDVWSVGTLDGRTLTKHWDGALWSIVPSPSPGTDSTSLTAVTAVSSSDVWAVGYIGDFNTSRTLAMHWNGSGWSVVPSPNQGTNYSGLFSVAAATANNVWAVGYSGSYPNERTLVMHWNGSNWSIVPSPNPTTNGNFLNSVTAVSANDVWAVGYYYPSSFPQKTLTMHWNGSIWSVVPSPNEGTSHNQLTAVSAISANDVWAIGRFHNSMMTMHWNGSNWTIVSSPNPGTYVNFPSDIVALSANDVWAVGFYYDNSGPGRTLTMHWDGATWSIVPSPNQGTSSNQLNAIAAVSSNNVWAVGSDDMSQGQWAVTLHWNGFSWAQVPDPSAPTHGSSLYSVEVISASDVWAVGYAGRYDRQGQHTDYLPLTMHWDGAGWERVPNPSPADGQSYLRSVSAVSANDVWAVGGYQPWSGSSRAITMHWDGSSWSIVPSPNPDPTSSGVSLTGVSALSANDVWAVGQYTDGSYQQKTLTQHWDGAAWSIVPSPSVTYLDFKNELTGVAALSPNDVWAVGGYTYFDEYNYEYYSEPLAIHWDGSSWSIVSSPGMGYILTAIAAISANDVWVVGGGLHHWDGSSWTTSPNPETGILNGIAAVSVNDVWAVGFQGEAPYDGSLRSLAMHWDGATWSIVPSPNQGTGSNQLNAVAAVSSNNVWAVGTDSPGYSRTLTMRYSEDCPVSTPTPTSTATASSTPTVTRTPASTATATPTYTPTPGSDFTLGVSPTSRSVGRSGVTTYTVNLASINSYSGSISLHVSGLPDRTDHSFSPNPVALTPGGSGSSVLTISTRRSTPAGTYTLTITGTDGVRTRSQTVTLVVNR